MNLYRPEQLLGLKFDLVGKLVVDCNALLQNWRNAPCKQAQRKLLLEIKTLSHFDESILWQVPVQHNGIAFLMVDGDLMNALFGFIFKEILKKVFLFASVILLSDHRDGPWEVRVVGFGDERV